MPQTKAFNLPPKDAIEFLRDKVRLPTRTWRDLDRGMHSRGFVIAGAQKTELLADMHSAVLRALEEGTTLEQFRDKFDEIVTRHGWNYKGGKGWRTAVIFNTNLSTAYSAGRYKQMTDPAVLSARPYWRYLPSSATEKRQEHTAWYNIVLPADHPWWDTHFPPNGWGCKCGVASVSQSELERLKEEEADGENPIRTSPPKDTMTTRKNPLTGQTESVVRGIDPGWDYNPGQARWGKQLSDKVFAEYTAMKGDAWERLTPGDWQSAGLPRMLPVDATKTRIGKTVSTVEAAEAELVRILGGEQKFFSIKQGQFNHSILLDAQSLAAHVDLNRSSYFPFIPEVLERPAEVWMSFERHKGTGKVELRTRFIKVVNTGKAGSLLMAAQAKGPYIQAWTFIPGVRPSYLEKQRQGKLIFRREK